MSDYHHNPNYIHHKQSIVSETIREVVFGVEDGMVSTMGAITGIAAGTGNHLVVLLSGFVIIAVESISMAVGSFLSSKSERHIEERMLEEEREEISMHLEEEKGEMKRLFIKDGWDEKMATKMAEQAAKNAELMLKEMAYRELNIIPEKEDSAFRNGLVMWVSYILGGSIPLFPYVFFDISTAVPISIVLTVIGLFILGVFTTRYSKRPWYKAGFEMLLLAGAAAIVGYAVGSMGDKFLSSRFK